MVVGACTMTMVAALERTMAAISAAFRFERPGDPRHNTAEALDHLGQHMIRENEYGVSRNLGRCMPIADVPSNARQRMCIFRGNLQQILGCGTNDDCAAIVKQ